MTLAWPLDIVFFGSSVASAYHDAGASYFRNIARALHQRGHRVRFFEPEGADRRHVRDVGEPLLAEVVAYEPSEVGAQRALGMAKGAELVIKISGGDALDAWLDREVLELSNLRTRVAYWDMDAPATLERCFADPDDPLRGVVADYDLVFTTGGGDAVMDAYEDLGARRCVAVHEALDPATHHPVAPDARFRGMLGFLGNRVPDRDARVDAYFFAAAEALPMARFLLGGSGWEHKPMPANVHYLGYVPTADHNAFNCTPRAVLDLHREPTRYGISPSPRIFEAAGAGACIFSEPWDGMDRFLEPDDEVVVIDCAEELAELLHGLSPARAASIGERARRRMLAEHTYLHRAIEIEAALEPAPRWSHRRLSPRAHGARSGAWSRYG